MSYPSYLMGPLKYREQITDQQVQVVDGHIAIPKGPGIGFTVDEQELRLDAREHLLRSTSRRAHHHQREWPTTSAANL